MNFCQLGAGFNSGKLRRQIKEGDVVGNAPGEQRIFLHDNPNFAADIGHAQLADGHAPIQDHAVGWREQTQQNFKQGGFATTAGARNGDMFARLNAKVHVVKQPRLALAVPK